MYNAEATSLEGFVQQLSMAYVQWGYYFYKTGIVPAGKDWRDVDRKLVEKYEIGVSKFVRARRKKQGLANVQFIRHGRFFVLVATDGKHEFFARESGIRDCRKHPIVYGGYSVSYGDRIQVRMSEKAFRELKEHFVGQALVTSREELHEEFWCAPFEPYRGVQVQMYQIWLEVNRVRKTAGGRTAGLRPLWRGCIRRRRTMVKPFEPIHLSPELRAVSA